MGKYTDDLRKIKSLLIVTSLQGKPDLKAQQLIEEFKGVLKWEPLADLLIEKSVWQMIVKHRKYDPKLVFCHPTVLISHPTTSLYYRCLTGLSLKAAKNYFGAVEQFEKGNGKAKLSHDKALKMARVYNMFLCSIIKNSSDWTLENGKRTIVATMGITIDGTMRNKVGVIAEERIRSSVFSWIIDNKLLIDPTLSEAKQLPKPPNRCTLKGNISMRFSSEPDISFYRVNDHTEELLAIVEIKGGIDPAGALERYGAATKSFQHGLTENPTCKNFFLSAVFTPELERRIKKDRLVEKYFDIIDILENPEVRTRFFSELFHFTLRLV